jgi:transcription antitermination factor NusG
MPILPAEPDCYPPGLWDAYESLPVRDDAVWWCLHTKPRQEKSTARNLRNQRIAYYLPQSVNESRTPQGRRIRSFTPLFAGYLFFHGDRHDRLEAIRGDRLVNVLEVSDQSSLVRDLRQVHQMLSSGLTVSSEPSVPIGASVRIISGPLTGMIGTVLRRANRDQFVVVVRFLGRGATVDLLDWQLEKVIE